MINKNVAKLINEQINKEMYSAYLYLDFANYFEDENLDGFASWYMVQAQEEMEHALKFRQYMYDNDEKVTLDAISKPNKKLTSPKGVLEEGYKHELYVSGLINNIYAEALKAKEFKTMNFLNWFVNEQVEEEKNAKDLIRKFEIFAGDKKGLYNLNNELKSRQK